MRPLRYGLAALGMCLFLIGCGSNESGYSILPDSEVFQQNSSAVNNKIDILFVINDQPSMSSKQQQLADSFATFISLFEDKGFDFRIAVVTSSAYAADPNLSGYDPSDVDESDFNDCNGAVCTGNKILYPDNPDLHSEFAVNARPDKNTSGQDARVFSSFRTSLTSSDPINQGFLRPDSFLAIVILDHGDDFSGNDRAIGEPKSGYTPDPISDYTDFLDLLTGTSGATRRYNVSAIVDHSSFGGPGCAGGEGSRIKDLVDNTKGVLGNICLSDFGPSLVDISNNIATLSTQFFLDRDPIVSTIQVLVDNIVVPNDISNGWTYDAGANSIVFHGSAIPAQDSTIVVNFDPATLDFD